MPKQKALPLDNLTPRERAILEGIAGGLDNADIARWLGLSEKTVRNHITRVFDKIQVQHRYEAIVRARDAGSRHSRGCALTQDRCPGSQLEYSSLSGPSPHDSPKTRCLTVTSRGRSMPSSTRGEDMPKFFNHSLTCGHCRLPKVELQAISQKSCGVLQSMGPQI